MYKNYQFIDSELAKAHFISSIIIDAKKNSHTKATIDFDY
jgi:hypothetical protein